MTLRSVMKGLMVIIVSASIGIVGVVIHMCFLDYTRAWEHLPDVVAFGLLITITSIIYHFVRRKHDENNNRPS